MTYDLLQRREVFHLALLRALARSVPTSAYAIKGGANLRFFFGSIRYSEDLDLDLTGLPVHVVRDKVMAILQSATLADSLRPFGIDHLEPPNISRAKQTETVQRFKVHLLTTAGEDLPTRLEFSRRSLDAPIRAESVSTPLLAGYRLPPLIVPHYTAGAAARQKLRALISRRQPEARDIFDLHALSTQPGVSGDILATGLSSEELRLARDRLYAISYQRYRDTVVSFLAPDDRPHHDSPEIWDEIRLGVIALLERPPEGT